MKHSLIASILLEGAVAALIKIALSPCACPNTLLAPYHFNPPLKLVIPKSL